MGTFTFDTWKDDWSKGASSRYTAYIPSMVASVLAFPCSSSLAGGENQSR